MVDPESTSSKTYCKDIALDLLVGGWTKIPKILSQMMFVFFHGDLPWYNP